MVFNLQSTARCIVKTQKLSFFNTAICQSYGGIQTSEESQFYQFAVRLLLKLYFPLDEDFFFLLICNNLCIYNQLK